jgi:pimeloyl-ACP methyl ester carboxylesterase
MHVSQQLVLYYIRTKFKFLSTISKRKAAEHAFELFCTPQARNKKKLPPIFEKAEVLNFPFLDYAVTGYRWNHPSEKKILILHGFESTITNFDRYIKPLISLGYEVLGFDAPAHGKSAGKRINAMVYKQLIREIEHRYGPVTNFLAHSLGGLAVCLYLDETPHDGRWKLVLVSPATETTTAINTFFEILKIDSSVREEFDSIIQEKSGHPPEWFSINRMAPNINSKTLWLHDKDDQLTPYQDMAPLMQRGFQHFHFHISEGLGHRRIYRDNKSFKAIISFFES